jgi:hypothetical protein
LRRLESSLLPVEDPETLAGRFLLLAAATRTPSSEGAIAVVESELSRKVRYDEKIKSEKSKRKSKRLKEEK